MQEKQLYDSQSAIFPYVTEDSFLPNYDSSYTEFSYTGDKIRISTQHTCGIKIWGSRAAYQQGIAIFGDMLVSFSNESTHYIYHINSDNSLTVLNSFTLATGHSNALQFAPTIESGETFPYLYVAGLSDKCYVIRIASDYTASIVQTITVGGCVIIGDDGYIWASGRDSDVSPRKFVKYRKVAVSEGDITLSAADIIDSFISNKIYDISDVTAQGLSVKFGKIWFCYGAAGSGQKRGVDVYDIATHRMIAELDFSLFSTLEYEDVDFYENSLLIATYPGTIYEVKF